MQRLVRCFLDSDMRCQHNGLAKIASKAKVNVYNLAKGEHVVFINGRLNRVKMFSPGGILSYLKVSKGQIDLATLALIPQAFNDGDIDVGYSRALKTGLKKRLGGE